MSFGYGNELSGSVQDRYFIEIRFTTVVAKIPELLSHSSCSLQTYTDLDRNFSLVLQLKKSLIPIVGPSAI